MAAIPKILVIDKATGSQTATSGQLVTLSAHDPSIIELAVPRAQIKTLVRHGADLIVTTEDGQTIVAHGYFANAQNALMIQDDGGLWSGDLSSLDAQSGGGVIEAAAAGSLFTPADSAVLAANAGTDAGVSASADAPSAAAPVWVPLALAGIGIGVAASGNGGGGHSAAATPSVQTSSDAPIVDTNTNTGGASSAPVTHGSDTTTPSTQTNGDGAAVTDTSTDTNTGGTSNSPVTHGTDATTSQAPPAPTIDYPYTVTTAGLITLTGTAEAGSTVTVTFSDNSTATGIAGADGHYSVTSSTSESATGSILVTATDAAGNVSAPATGTVSPSLPGLPFINNIEQNPDGTLTVTGKAIPGDTVTVTYPDQSTVTGTVNADGSFSVQSQNVQTTGSVSAVDTNASGTSLASGTHTWTDTTAPLAPTVNTPYIANADGTITLTGTAEAGSTVTATFSDNSTATGIAGADGHYSVTSSASESATGSILVTATDAAGNVSAATAVDLPGTPGNAIQITGITPDSGASASDFITNSHALVIHGTLSQPLLHTWIGTQFESVRVSLDGGQTWNEATFYGTTWTYDNTANPLPDGTYTVEAEIYQSASLPPAGSTPVIQVIGQTTQQVVVDSTAPTETVTIAATSSDGATISGTLSATLADGSHAGVSAEQLQISLDSGVTWQNVTVAPGSTAWSYASTTPLANGATVQARVVDTAGNDGTVATQTVAVSSSNAIEIQITGITPDSGVSASDFITNGNALVIHGTLSQPLINPAGNPVSSPIYQSVQVSLDGGQTWHDATVNGTAWTYDATANPLPDGTYTVQAEVYQAPMYPPASFSSVQVIGETTQQVVVDSTAPTETVTIAATSSDGTTISGALSATLADGSHAGVSAEQLQISLDSGVTWQNVTVAPGSTAWSYASTTPLANGATVQARVVDTAGNDGTVATQTVAVSSSNAIEIQITGITPDSGASASDFITNGHALVIHGTLSQPLTQTSGTAESVRVSLDGGQSWDLATVNGTAWTYDNTANPLPDGAYTVEVEVYQTPRFPPVGVTPVIQVIGQTTQQVVVDSTAPTETVTIAATSSDGATISGTLSAALADGSHAGVSAEQLQISLDNGATWQNVTVNPDDVTAWVYHNDGTPIANGASMSVEARVVDAAGNSGPTATQTVTVADNVIQITGVTLSTGTSSNDFITNDNALVIHGTLSQVPSSADYLSFAGYGVRVSLDGGQTWNYAAVNGMTWTYDNTANPLPDGTYTVQAKLIPVEGIVIFPPPDVVISESSQQVVVDTTAPTETVTIAAISSDGSDDMTVSGALSAALADGSQPGVSAEQLQISLDGGATWQNVTVAPGSTMWSHTSSTPLTDVGVVEARITDAAGNHGQTFMVVGTPLVLQPLAISDIVHTTDGMLTVIGTATAGDTVTVTFADGGMATNTADSSGHYSITSIYTMQTSGSVSVTETSPDGVTSQPITKTWIDTTPPPLDAAVSADGIVFGITESGSAVTVTFPDGSTMTGIADFNGVFSLTSSMPVTPGESVTLTATNAGGTSQPETIPVDYAMGALPPPDANGIYTVASGNNAPPGSYDILISSDGTTYGTQANASGHYEFSSWTPISGPYVIALTGGEQPPIQPLSIDTQVPDLDNTLTVTGSANPGDTVTVTFADHSTATGVADSSGHYSITSPGVETSTDVSATDTHADGTTVQTWAGTDTPPPPPVVDLAASTSNADGTLTVAGTAQADSLVMVNFPDYSVGTFIAQADGSYSITSGAPQPAGRVVVTDTDAAGNASQPTEYYSTGLPLPPVENVVQNSDGTLTVTGYAPPGDTVTLTYSDNSTATGAPDASGQYSITSPGVETGSFMLAETSPSGAIIGPLMVVWSQVSVGGVMPTETPAITAVSPDTLAADGSYGSANDFITSTVLNGGDGSLTVNGTLDQALQAGEHIQVSLNGGSTWYQATVAADGTDWSAGVPLVTDGGYTLQAEVVNAAGVAGTLTMYPLTVDNTAPAETVTIAATSGDGTTISGTLSAALADGSQPGVSAEQLQISLDNGATWQNVTVPHGNTAWVYNSSTDFSLGNLIVEARVVDAAGNTGPTMTQAVNVLAWDGGPPVDNQTETSGPVTVSLAQITGITEDTGASPNDFVTSDNTLIFHGTLNQPLPDPSSGITEYVQVSLDGQTWHTAAVDGTGVNWSFDNTAVMLPDGLYLAEARVADAAGNASQPVAVQQVEVSASGTLNLSLSDVLNDVDTLASAEAAQRFTINSGGVVSKVDLTDGIGTGPNQWQDTGAAIVNGVFYDVYHNTSQGANTAADLLIQHGIAVM